MGAIAVTVGPVVVVAGGGVVAVAGGRCWVRVVGVVAGVVVG